MSSRTFKISINKTMINFVFIVVLVFAALFSCAMATVLFPMVIVWLILLLLLAIPNYELDLKGWKKIAFDIAASIFTAFFTTYFSVLLVTVFSNSMLGFSSLIRRLLIYNPAELFIGMVIAMPAYWALRACRVPTKAAMAVTPFGFLLAAFVDYIVYYTRGDELIASDILSAGTAFGVAGNYRISMITPAVLLIIPYALYICACMRIKMVNREKADWRSTLIKAVAAVVTAVSCVGLLKVYGRTHDAEAYSELPSMENGIIINLCLTADFLHVDKPEGYTGDEYFESVYGNYSYSEPEEKVNVIVVMNEAFFDPDQRNLELNKDPDPFFDSFSDNCIKGYALSSVYGGRTANSEFEFLTGLTTAYLPNGSVVYSMYAKNPLPSLIGYSDNLNYNTYGLHPYRNTSWNRDKIYPDMGFETTCFENDFVFGDSGCIREYCSDECAYENTLNWITDENEATFTFLVTMQNHSAYFDNGTGFVADNYIDGDEEANTYFTLLSHSDKALEGLIDRLSEEEEKYVLVFFGDHQPKLNVTSGSEGPGGDSWYVPYMIWANYELPEGMADSDAGLTCIPYLGIDLLRVMGQDLPPYYQYINEIREVIPAINASGYYSRTAGRFLPLDEVVDEAEGEALLKYQYLQYCVLFDHGDNPLVSDMLPAG